MKPIPGRAKPDFGPSIVDGVLRYLSVSQITTYDRTQPGGCPRKWFIEKVLGVKVPGTKKQAAGQGWHAESEHYHLTGEDVLSPVMRAAKHLLPGPGPGLLIEQPIHRPFGPTDPRPVSLVSAAGVPLVGFIDIVVEREHTVDSQGELRPMPTNSIELIDIKTTSSIASWAKAGDQLPDTVQMCGYGVGVSNAAPSLDQLRLSHIYAQTEGRKLGEKRSALVSVESLHRRWERVDGLAREMADVARETDITHVEPNLGACGAFRGCPHRAICPRPVEDILAGLFDTKDTP